MANIFQQIASAIQSGGFSSGSAKTPTSKGGGTKNGGGSNASTASNPKSTSSKATSNSYKRSTGGSNGRTANSTARKEYLSKYDVGSSSTGGGSSSGGSSKSTAGYKALADYAEQSAVERARQRVDEATKDEPKKSYGFDALNAEVKAAQDKAKSAETNYLATLEKFNYNAGAPEVKSAKQVLDDALREAKIFTAAAENGADINRNTFNVEEYYEKAKEETPTTISLLLADEGAYSAKRTEIMTDATDEEKEKLAQLQEQDKQNGTNEAEAYRREIEARIEQERGAAKAEEIQGKEGLGKALSYAGQAVQSGFGKTMNDLAKTFGFDTQDKTQAEYTAGTLRQGLEETGSEAAKTGFDVAQGIGAMIPSLVASSVPGGALAGKVVQGITSASSAYQDKLAEGWEQGESATYGLLEAASEVALSSALGGISKLGGTKSLSNLSKALTGKINNVLLKATANASIRALAEGGEEAMQTYISPAIESVVRSVPYDSPDFEEVLHNAIVGAATSAVLGVGEFASDIRNTTETPTVEANQTTTPAPVVNTQNEEILQASESANNAVSSVGGEITPSAQQNAEIGAPVEFNATTAQSAMGKGPERERNMSEGVRNNPANEAELRQSFEEAPEMYTQLTNAEVQAKADAILAKGFEAAEKEVTEAIGRAKTGQKLAPEYAVAAQNIANELVRTKDEANIVKARDLMSDVMAEFTAAGQFAQIGRLLRQSDPATKAMTIQKLVEKLNADLSKRQTAKNIKRGVGDAEGKIVVSDELLNRFASASDEATRDAVMNEIEQTIANQIPATFRDKFTALRYLNMLGNFKTQGRNIVGNSLAAVATATKRRVQAATELGAALATGGKYERNTSLFVSRDLRKAAAADFANVEAAAMGEAKYSDVGKQVSKGIQDKQKVFDNKLLEGYRKATNWAMEAGDTIFLKFHYADALAGYLQARGVSKISEASPELLNSARAFAIKEAQEATFRDDNAVSNFVTKIGRGQDTPRVVKTISEGIMPFRKTPANVAVRAVEYSPVGLLKSATVDAYRASQGDISPADVINNVAKGATGSALAIAGYLLAQAGLAKGSEEDDKLAAFQKNQGEMDYSIKIGDTYVSLSQFAPMAVPFFMGVKLQEILEAQEGAISLNSATELLGAITDPMLEMSMLSGVNDAFSNLSNVSGDADALPQLALNAMMSYWMQGLTNGLLGQFEQATEKNRQTTYTANETELDKFLGKGQYKVGQLAAKTPGVDYHQQDYVDAWGRTQSNGDAMTRALNAFLNPTFSSKDRSTEVDAELERLYRDNKNTEDFPDVFPQKRGRSEVYGDGKVMTPDEYLQFSKDSGQMKLELVSDFMASEQYANLDDKQRAEVINDLYQFADDRALKKVKEANGVNAKSDWDDVAALPNLPAYLSAKTAYADAADINNESPNYKAVDAVLAALPTMDRATRDKLDEQSGFKNLRFASEVYGMDSAEFFEIKNLLKTEQASGLMGKDSGASDAAVISKKFEGTDAEKIAALETQNLPYADTGKRRSVVRRFEAAQTENISFDEWAKIEAYVDATKTSDTPNKATIVAAGEKYGYSGSLVYQIYKKISADEDIVQQTNDYFHKDYVEPVGADLAAYLTGEDAPDTEAAKKSGGGRGYGGRGYSRSSKPADLGDSVAAVKSIANSASGSSNSSKYMRQALNDLIAQGKKKSAQPSVNWETLLAGYVKGIK